MKTKNKTVLVMAIITALGANGSNTQAAAVAIGSMSITGGQFEMGSFTPVNPVPITHTSGADITAGYVAPTWEVTTRQTGPAPGAIMAFAFGDPWVNVYSAASSVQGVSGGGPVPNGTFENNGGAISVDLTSFFTTWNGIEFNQGGIATGTTDNCTEMACDFTVNWIAEIVTGPKSSNFGTWQATGTVSAVPVPAAVWLMGFGLMSLVGLAHRRTRNN